MNQPKLADEEISPQEKHFWERMTFRQFCLLFIRMQAIWLLLNTAIDLTYLPPYFNRLHQHEIYPNSESYLDAKRQLFLAVMRVALNLGLAVAVISYTEEILRWFVKDWIPRKPVNDPPSE